MRIESDLVDLGSFEGFQIVKVLLLGRHCVFVRCNFVKQEVNSVLELSQIDNDRLADTLCLHRQHSSTLWLYFLIANVLRLFQTHRGNISDVSQCRIILDVVNIVRGYYKH